MGNLIVKTYINGEQKEFIMIDKDDRTKSIVGHLENIKNVNTTIAALYNDQENILDVVKGTDEFSTTLLLSELIRVYPYDLFDASLYAIVNTTYAKNIIGFINTEFKLAKKFSKKEKHISLIKKANQ